MPKRLAKFVFRHSGRFFGVIICKARTRFFYGDHRWQEVALGDDSGLHRARICGFCGTEEISDEAVELKDLAEHTNEKGTAEEGTTT